MRSEPQRGLRALGAGQRDVMPAQRGGRAGGVRSAVRNTRGAFGPRLFGLVASRFIAGGAALQEGGSEVVPGQTRGLQIAFLLTLIPLAGAGILLLRTRRHYPVDVASAGESERRGKEHLRGGP